VHELRNRGGWAAGLAVLAVVASLSGAGRATAAGSTFGSAGAAASAALVNDFYAGDGAWHMCVPVVCGTAVQDWGADSLTYTLWLRESTTHDAALVPMFSALAAAIGDYPAPCTDRSCTAWSDVPQWDTIALLRDYEVTRDPAVLAKAQAAFDFVESSTAYALGACPAIRYQQPYGGANDLKTLEDDANAVKAALLLYRDTGTARYLAIARKRYASVRFYFLDPSVPLYSVYVFDDGRTCTQLPHRFFASVNGDMIWNGVELYRDTHEASYLGEALGTAHAVDTRLADPRGIFADLQAENDIVEPLVEAMYVLAADEHAAFARSWILRNAAAALGARTADGAFGRFFDGPPPATTVTAWQTNGGLALEIAAAALAPRSPAVADAGWGGAVQVEQAITGTPAHITFRGAGIALVGTLGEQCCEPGHIRLFVDGRETFDETGIWQNKSSSGIGIPNTVLFAWRWRTPGRHTIAFEAGVPNGKEGTSFVHIQRYDLIRG
jgi:hypothetical protein